ncbi:enoyl-CoA hydratase-related protein [Candidatus Nephthysia bennettiae]|uniref:enoyl-CoA hydratase/isomerase family protein n=1 Tax=Candidatus Nephthysia bennettiae TaxID=3127016 RepID=UPI0030C6D46B
MSDPPRLDNVLVEVRGDVATVVLNRPEQRNALSSAMLRDLHAAFQWCRGAGEIRVVVLTGAGDRAFCAGADLASFSAEVPELERHEDRRQIVELFLLLEDLGKPVVGRINGHALAGGFGLACACDLLLAVAAASFATPEIRVGVWPAMIQAVLARNLPRKVLLEMMLLGDRWTAEQMREVGLVNRVVGSLEELDAVTAEVTASLARKSPLVLKLGRDSFYRQQDMEFRAALEYLRSQLTLISLSEDAREGVTAFFEKREPEFKGR